MKENREEDKRKQRLRDANSKEESKNPEDSSSFPASSSQSTPKNEQ